MNARKHGPAADVAAGCEALPLLSCRAEQLGVLSIPGPPGRAGTSSTPYLDRGLDQELLDAAAGAANGETATISLIGERSTGKKRAMWQLINRRPEGKSRLLLEDWHVWPGTSPSDPVTLLAEMAKLPPKTVLWLAPAERYFSDDDAKIGNDVALALRRLLGDPRRGPYLLLCSFTPRGWQTVTAMPPATGVDKYQQVRMLLLAGHQVGVPDSFTESEVERAIEMGDPRLAEAAVRATDEHVIQYLTAAPWLNAAITTASPPARAVLKFCIAVRRTGHGRWIPRGLIELGAVGFMSRPVRTALDDDWLSLALAELTRRGAGGLSLLGDLPAPGHSDDGRGRWFHLDEYVERRWLTSEPVQEADDHLWSALVTAADRDSLIGLAEEARRRGLLLQCNQLFRRAIDEGVPSAAKRLIELFRQVGRIDDALSVYDELIEGGCDEARMEAAEMLIAAGRRTEAVGVLGEESEASDRTRLLYAMALAGEKPASAVAHYRELAEGGDADAAGVAADMMSDHERDGGLWNGRSKNRYGPAIDWLTALMDEKNVDTRSKIVEIMLLRDEDAIEGAIHGALGWLADRGRGGDHLAYVHGAWLLTENNQTEEALSWCGTAAAYDGASRAVVAMIYAKAGFLDAAFQHATAAAAHDPTALTRVAELLGQKGLLQRALEGFRRAAELGDTNGWVRAAEVAAEAGWVDEAIGFVRRAERAGARVAGLREAVAAALGRSGKTAEAIEWYLEDADLNDPRVLAPVSDSLLNDTSFQVAAEQYARRARVGRGEAMSWVAEGLLQVGYRELAAQSNQLINTGSMSLDTINAKLVVAAEYCLPAAALAGHAPAWLRTVDVLLDLGRYESAERRLSQAQERAGIFSEIHSAIILAYRHGDNARTVVSLVEDQVSRSITGAVVRTARALFKYEKLEEAERLLMRGRDAGDLASRIALADYFVRSGQFTKALDEYFVALVHGCDVIEKITRVMRQDRNEPLLREFRQFGLTPQGKLADAWSPVPARAETSVIGRRRRAEMQEGPGE